MLLELELEISMRNLKFNVTNKIQIFTIGNDWKGEFDELSDICDIVYIDRTKGISTSNLKDNLVSGN
jgi:glycerol-3-phosphate cytidylyltransferase|tara:strand:+ start:297 stop:497 length:201 start_codon:yes stop_codon:yes gene_type:complete